MAHLCVQVQQMVAAEDDAEPLGIQDSMLNMNIGNSTTGMFS